MLGRLCGHSETPVSFCCKASGKLTSFSQIDSGRSRPMFDGSPWCGSGLALCTTGRCQNMSELFCSMSDHACYCFADCETCFRALLAGWSCFGWRVLPHVRPSKIPASRSFISLVPKIRLCSSGFLEWRVFLETRMPVSLTSQQLRRRSVAQSCLRVFSS